MKIGVSYVADTARPISRNAFGRHFSTSGRYIPVTGFYQVGVSYVADTGLRIERGRSRAALHRCQVGVSYVADTLGASGRGRRRNQEIRQPAEYTARLWLFGWDLEKVSESNIPRVVLSKGRTLQVGSDTIIGVAIGALATGLVGGAGFLLKRWVTGERTKERAEELSVLTSVAVQMRSGDVSVAEIDALRKYLRHGLRLESLPAPTIADDKGPITRLEMNDAAISELENSYDEMRDVLNEISKYLDKDETTELLAAQVKWQEFKHAHANFVSKIFEDGSMRPLWFITTIDIATRDRINELQGYLEARRDS